MLLVSSKNQSNTALTTGPVENVKFLPIIDMCPYLLVAWELRPFLGHLVARSCNEDVVHVMTSCVTFSLPEESDTHLESAKPSRAEKAKTQFANRFIPSRFVVTRPNPEEFKARWRLRGYLDPDVMELVGSGSTQSPTVSQLGRMLSCQVIVSNGWNLQLGDSRGAFLEADALDRKQGPLFSSLPPRGIPGVPEGAVILILGNICGLNDAPQRWWEKFDAVMTSIGFFRCTFYVRVYTLRGCVFMWMTQFEVDRVLCFPKL